MLEAWFSYPVQCQRTATLVDMVGEAAGREKEFLYCVSQPLCLDDLGDFLLQYCLLESKETELGST